MTKDYTGQEMVHLPIPISMLGAVYALLGGVAAAAVASGTCAPLADLPDEAEAPKAPTGVDKVAESDTAKVIAEASDVSGELDAAGHPWSAELHASTKGKTGEGLWRMKVGQNRPDPMPGYPKGEATGTSASATGSAGSTASAPSAAPATGDAEDDEFAAFAAAAGKSTAAAPARKWTVDDLSKLTNQAAVKLGDPAPIKAIIADFVPEGEVPHSRNIPDDQREAFAKAIEAKAGITFEG